MSNRQEYVKDYYKIIMSWKKLCQNWICDKKAIDNNFMQP